MILVKFQNMHLFSNETFSRMSESLQSVSPSRRSFYVASCFAASFFMCWLVSMVFYLGITLPQMLSFDWTGALFLYLVFFGCAIGAAIVFWRLGTFTSSNKIPLLVLAATAILLGGGSFFALFFSSSTPGVFCFVGLSGIGATCLVALNSLVLGQFPHRVIVFSTPVALILASLWMLVFYYLLPAEVSLCSLWISPAVCAMLVMCSLLLLDGIAPAQSKRSPAEKMDWRSSGAVIAHEACMGFMFYAATLLCAAGRTEVVLICALVACAVGVVSAVLGMCDKKKSSYFISEKLQLKFTLPLATLGIAPMAIANDTGRIVCCVVLVAAFAPQVMTNINALAENVRIRRLDPVRSFCGGYVANFSGLLLGFMFACVTFWFVGQGLVVEGLFLEVVLLSILMFLSSALFDDRYPVAQQPKNMSIDEGVNMLSSRSEQEDNGSKLRWKDKCALVSNQAELSPRQAEVFFLLSRGYSNKSIEEQLNISSHTVKSHITAIYQKTGVHSKQEIIDLVKSAKSNSK